MGSKVLKTAAPILGAIAGSFIPGLGTGVGAALGSGLGTAATGGNLKQSLLSAGGSYLGGQLAGNVFGPTSTVGNALAGSGTGAGLFGNETGNVFASALGGLADTSLGSIAGSYAGNSIADSLSGVGMPAAPRAPSGPAPFSPSQQDPAALPGSLQGFGALNPTQQGTNIANQGVYGQGLGPDENKYFLNLVNRQLVDKSGQTSDMSSLQPIESSYLQKLGLGGYGNTNDLLKAISTWHAA